MTLVLSSRFCYSEDDIVGFIVQILQGIEYLHNGRILHLDIKPDNIMVTNRNGIKIIDFGSAQRFNPLSLRRYSRELGTLEYMGMHNIQPVTFLFIVISIMSILVLLT